MQINYIFSRGIFVNLSRLFIKLDTDMALANLGEITSILMYIIEYDVTTAYSKLTQSVYNSAQIRRDMLHLILASIFLHTRNAVNIYFTLQ